MPALNVVAVSANVQRPSKTLALVDALIAQLGRQLAIRPRIIELGPLLPDFGASPGRRRVGPAAEAALLAVENADLLLAASPIYRGTYTGHFKHFFDLVGQDALVDKPVLLAATGGSDRHALVIDHQFRPLFSFFQALTLPIGVYGTDRDFERHEVSSSALGARIELATIRAAGTLAARFPRAVIDADQDGAGTARRAVAAA